MTIEVPMRFESESLLWVVNDIYSEQECANFVKFIESSSPKLATNNPLYRNQDRVIIDDPEMAQELFRRLKLHLPPKMGDLKLIRLNERLRMYRYKVGQSFTLHLLP
jgi:hypothetical protein